MTGHDIDLRIGEILLEKVSKSTFDVTLAVHAELQSKFAHADRIRYQHVEKLKYEMDVAKRRYRLVDPENRLVADELESDWNHKIIDFQKAHIDYKRKQSEDLLMLGEEKKLELLSLTSDFPRLWTSQSIENRDRKRLVKLLICDVTLTKRDRDIKVQIRFPGGASQELELMRPRSAWEEKKHSPEVIAEIDRLLNEHTYAEIATLLNEGGYCSGTGKTFDAKRVSIIRRAYKLTSLYTRLRQQGFLSIKEMCEKFGISRHKVYALRRSKKLRAYRYDDVGRYMYKLPEGELLTP